MTDRSGELVPCSWSLVRERALTTGLCVKEWYSEHSGICRGMELPRRSVQVKKVWEVCRGRTIQRFKEKWSEFEIKPVLNGSHVEYGEEVWHDWIWKTSWWAEQYCFELFETCQEGVCTHMHLLWLIMSIKKEPEIQFHQTEKRVGYDVDTNRMMSGGGGRVGVGWVRKLTETKEGGPGSKSTSCEKENRGEKPWCYCAFECAYSLSPPSLPHTHRHKHTHTHTHTHTQTYIHTEPGTGIACW